jgi:hypothetical protein
MKKVILFAFTLFLMFSQTFAQETTSTKKEVNYAVNRIGLITGLGLSKGRFVADGANDLNNDLKNYTTGSAMFFWEKGKNEHFITQVGLGYAGKGYKNSAAKLSLHYIELPIIMNFRMNITGPVYLMAGFGPIFSAAFAGTYKYADEDTSFTNRDILEYKIGINSSSARAFNSVDVGLIFNGNVEIDLPQGKCLEVGVNYKLGFNKISNKSVDWNPMLFGQNSSEAIDPEYKNGVLTFTLAYLFDRKK